MMPFGSCLLSLEPEALLLVSFIMEDCEREGEKEGAWIGRREREAGEWRKRRLRWGGVRGAWAVAAAEPSHDEGEEQGNVAGAGRCVRHAGPRGGVPSPAEAATPDLRSWW